MKSILSVISSIKNKLVNKLVNKDINNKKVDNIEKLKQDFKDAKKKR